MHFCYRRTIRLKQENFSCNKKTNYRRRQKFITHKNNCCQVFSRSRNDQPLFVNKYKVKVGWQSSSLKNKFSGFRREKCISQFHLRPGPPPRADPRELAFFLPWMANSPGVGTLELANPPGWGRKKRAKPRPPSTVQHFLLIAQSNSAILMWDFLFQLTSSFVIHSFFFISVYFIRISRLKFAKF